MGGKGSGRRAWVTKPGQLVARKVNGSTEYVRQPEPGPDMQGLAVAVMASGVVETVQEAMRVAGYAKPTNGASVDLVRDRMLKVAEAVNLTPERMMQRVSDSLDAKKAVVTKGGCVEVADNDARLRAVDIGLKIYGVGQPERAGGGNITLVEVIYSPQAPQHVVCDALLTSPIIKAPL